MDKVYHGSPNGNIEELEARVSTHQKKCIYATESKAVAMSFMGKGHGDLDTLKNYNNGILELVERRPGVLEELFNKEGYIYELDGSTFDHYDYLWGPEVISFEEKIKPIKKTHYDNILEALEEEEKLGNIKIYRYPERPFFVPLDNSDLIDKYIGFEERGLTGAINRLLDIYPEFTDQVDEKLKHKKR